MVKYYGPGGLNARGIIEVDASEPSRTEGADSIEERRPFVPNRIVLLPNYDREELLTTLCGLLPSQKEKLEEFAALASLPRSISVVCFVELLALVFHDADQEDSLVRESDPVEFWLELEDMLQTICSRRLKPRKYTALQYNASEDALRQRSGSRLRGRRATSEMASKSESMSRGERQKGVEIGPDGLPVLTLIIPEDSEFAG